MLNSVLLFAFGLPLLLVDLYPHRFPAVARQTFYKVSTWCLHTVNLYRICRFWKKIVRHKIQPVLNAPLAPHLVQQLLAVAALNSVVVGTVTLSLARYLLPLLVCLYVCLYWDRAVCLYWDRDALPR